MENNIYDNTNRGVLFANDRRPTDNHPTHTGTINVGGVEYWLSAWVKVSSKDPGRRFFSLSVERKEEQPGTQTRTQPVQSQPPLEDDIPF